MDFFFDWKMLGLATATIEDLVVFPRAKGSKKVENLMFKTAYKLDTTLSSKEAIVEAVHLYSDAFEHGTPDAGVNLLRILVKVQSGLKDEGTAVENLPFQKKTDYYIRCLKNLNHPAGFYYEALQLCLGLVNNGLSDTDNLNDGADMMCELALVGNEYAKAFFKIIDD